MSSEPKGRRGRALLRAIVWSPVIAIPMAAFVWFRDAAAPSAFGRHYVPTLIFVLAGWICLWIAQHFVFPRIVKPDAVGPRTMLLRLVFYLGAMLAGFAAAALVVNATIVPDLLSGPRQIAMLGMYGVLFITMSLAIGFAVALYHRVEERARADQELKLARRIQSSFLPANLLELPLLDVSGLNVPSKQVSGDFYDLVPTGESALLIAIADVAGKGVPAALLSSMLQASLRTQAPSVASVASILGNINALVYRNAAVEQFATFFLAHLDLGSRRLSYANAGHNYPVLFRAGGGHEVLDHGGPLIGIQDSVAYEESAVSLGPGDRLLLYTDGISEAANPSGELFGEERLCRLVESMPTNLPSRAVTQRILEDLRRHAGTAEQADDMTLVVIQMRSSA